MITPLKLVLHHPYSRGFTHTVVMAVRWQQAYISRDVSSSSSRGLRVSMTIRKTWMGAQATKKTRLTRVSRMLVRLRLAAFLVQVALALTSAGSCCEDEDTVTDTLDSLMVKLKILFVLTWCMRMRHKYRADSTAGGCRSGCSSAAVSRLPSPGE